MQCGVAAPFQALIRGELAGALAFEEEDALAEGVVVVVAAADRLGKQEEREEQSRPKCGNISREAKGISRHFLLPGLGWEGECMLLFRASKQNRLGRFILYNEKTSLDSRATSNGRQPRGTMGLDVARISMQSCWEGKRCSNHDYYHPRIYDLR